MRARVYRDGTASDSFAVVYNCCCFVPFLRGVVLCEQCGNKSVYTVLLPFSNFGQCGPVTMSRSEINFVRVYRNVE